MRRFLIVLILTLNIGLKASEPAGGAGAEPEDDYLTSLIRSVNPLTCEYLDICELQENTACLVISEDEDYNIDFNTTNLYPVMVLSSDFLDLDTEKQKEILGTLTILYNKAFQKAELEMAPEECDLVINLIKEVAPKLSSIIEKIDNSCEIHIKRNLYHKQVSVNIAPDGLPLIMIGTNFLNECHEDQIFIIAHELSHYLLEHNKLSPVAKISNLSCTDISKLDKLNKIFKKSYSRVKEYEADRYAVLNFGVNPDYGINWMKRRALNEGYKCGISRTQFQSTHPEWGPRIAQLEQIKYDLSVGNLKSERKVFDWSAIANSNLEI